MARLSLTAMPKNRHGSAKLAIASRTSSDTKCGASSGNNTSAYPQPLRPPSHMPPADDDDTNGVYAVTLWPPWTASDRSTARIKIQWLRAGNVWMASTLMAVTVAGTTAHRTNATAADANVAARRFDTGSRILLSRSFVHYYYGLFISGAPSPK